MEFTLSSSQQELIQNPPAARLFLQGPPGSGKTTIGAERLRHLIESGVPADQILILVPQRTLARPYYDVLMSPDLPAGSLPDIVTLGGLGQRLIALFFPIIAQDAGFAHPERTPVFLTLETAQYAMAQIVQPLLEKGYFESLVLDRNRLYSQILDNLNKAAGVGFDHRTIAERLKAAWLGEPAQIRIYEETQECASLFRDFCLEHTLLDFSLQLEIFVRVLWKSLLCRELLFSRYKHLIYDNVEEDVPVVHDIIREWLPFFDTALLIYDEEAGYRAFLGADPESGFALREHCDGIVAAGGSWVMSSDIHALTQILSGTLRRERPALNVDLKPAFTPVNHRFYPQMVDWVGQRIDELIHQEHIPPGEIVVLSPYLSDSMRFALMTRLEELGIPNRSHRPSRSLREELATACLFTLAKLAHPAWGLAPNRQEVRQALLQAVDGMDLVRAELLSATIYNPRKFEDGLKSFDTLIPEMQERITFALGERYEYLRRWLEQYQQEPSPDLEVFISRVFNEVLVHPGFGFRFNLDRAGVTARLIESIQKFRTVLEDVPAHADRVVGREYIQMVEAGLIAAQSLKPYAEDGQDAVLVSPAFTYLMRNRPAAVQFWLDAGSLGWSQRLYQPLTHPYVLSRRWQPGSVWGDGDEDRANQEIVARLTGGLLHRCRQHVYLCTTGIDQRGNEERGALLQAIQSILRRAGSSPKLEVDDV